MNKLLICIALVVTGCATTGTSLQSKSARLENESRELYAEVRDQIRQHGNDRGNQRASVSRAAEALIISARDLNTAIERRAANERVLIEFDRVARDYKQLHESLAVDGYADQNRNVLAEFDGVTKAYLAIEDSLGSRSARIGQADTNRDNKLAGTDPAVTEREASADLERRARLKSFWFP